MGHLVLRSRFARLLIRIISAVAVIRWACLLIAAEILLLDKIRDRAGSSHLGAMAGILRGAAVRVADGVGRAALFLERRWSRWVYLLVAMLAVDNALMLCHVWFITGGVIFSLLRTGGCHPKHPAPDIAEVRAGLAQREVDDHSQLSSSSSLSLSSTLLEINAPVLASYFNSLFTPSSPTTSISYT